jgi:hypothetical protein
MVYIRSNSVNNSCKVVESQVIVYTKDAPGLEHGTSKADDIVSDLKTISGKTSGVNLKHIGDIEAGTNGKVKVGKQRLRFNLIFNLLLWILVPLPFWLQYVVPFRELALWILFSIQGSFLLFWIVVLVLGKRDDLILFHFEFLTRLVQQSYEASGKN